MKGYATETRKTRQTCRVFVNRWIWVDHFFHVTLRMSLKWRESFHWKMSRDPLWIVANNEDSSLFRCEFFQTFIGSTFQKDQKRHQGSLLFWSIQAKCQEGKGADVTVKNCRLKFILRIYYIKKLPVAGDIDSCLFLRFLLNIKTVEYNKPLPDGTKPLSQVANMEFLRL